MHGVGTKAKVAHLYYSGKQRRQLELKSRRTVLVYMDMRWMSGNEASRPKGYVARRVDYTTESEG